MVLFQNAHAGVHDFDQPDNNCGRDFREMAMSIAVSSERPCHAYEPKPRVAHYAGAVEGECFICW